ncbi:hypothetical protein UPYG_G00303650 [Umbra pygmaea]|uniref:Origin recognition complex subunit 2 n=1 Tax=Umbra pygmaea TaxID=75934 RepID=A0ABD0WTM6_UMBPY
MTHFRGSDCLRGFAKLSRCKVSQVTDNYKTGEKHAATLSTVLNMTDTEMDQLANFLGHDIRIHREFYRLPEKTLQLAKISKVLMALEQGRLAEFHGKNLDEIGIDPDEKKLLTVMRKTVAYKRDTSSTVDELSAELALPPTEKNDMPPPPKRHRPQSDEEMPTGASAVRPSYKGKSTQKKTPWHQTEVERCAVLAERLALFQVLVDHRDALDQLTKRPLAQGRLWHVWLKLDCANGRAGVLHSEPEALRLAQAISESEGVELTGVYAHCGNTYGCKGAEQIHTVAQETTTRVLQFMEKLKAVDITCKSSIGSTPSCSQPVSDMAKLSEVHPGNYVFYDVQQFVIGSCSLEDVAVRVLSRVIGHCPHRNQLLIDCGWTALSLDGAGKLPTGYAVIEGHPDLRLLSMTQEHGRLEPLSGQLDYSRYPLGTLLTIIPYHACATAAMHPVYYIHSAGRLARMSVLEVRFVGDADVLEHIVDKQEGVRGDISSVQRMVNLRSTAGSTARVDDDEDDEDEVLNEQHYIQALGTDQTKEGEEGVSAVPGASVFSFQTVKRSNRMALTASELARTPVRTVSFSTNHNDHKTLSKARTPQKGKKRQFVSTTPHRLRKRLSAPSLRSDSDSELSPSDSDEERGKEEEKEEEKQARTPSKPPATALSKTPAKKNKAEPASQACLVEEYFEAHGSSKVLTSDRTLQRLHTPKLDRETLFRVLEANPSCYSSEIETLHSSHHKHFYKWMLQLQLGYSVLVYGLGSKKTLLEEFRISMLSQEIHLVVNGFFPSITLKSILTALSAEVLEYQGTFRNPADQIHYITTTLREQPDLHVYLLIHNIDGPMLRGGKTQNALGQLASLPNLHLVASIDHINAPLVWDQSLLCQFNWLWWECVCFQRYVEETSYENSLLVQQTGALALSSLTHVLRSLTANARGIFKVLVEFQLQHRDNPSYTGLSFQDFYQRCREAFLVNSDLTLRTQLTEFRDHKLIRTRKGADGVEYLLVAVETSTLTDFLEKEEVE